MFGPSGFWIMAPLRYAAKFNPFLSLDCAPTPSTLAQSKERKGSNFAIWQPWRRFAVLGLRSVDDPAPVPLGNFTYEDSGDPVQTFRVEDERGHPPFRLVELKILDNHGNMVYTCVYRFRVHGTIA